MPNMKLLLGTLVFAIGLSQVTARPAGVAPEAYQSSSVNAAGPRSDAHPSHSKHSDGGAYPISKAAQPTNKDPYPPRSRPFDGRAYPTSKAAELESSDAGNNTHHTGEPGDGAQHGAHPIGPLAVMPGMSSAPTYSGGNASGGRLQLLEKNNPLLVQLKEPALHWGASSSSASAAGTYRRN